MTCNCLSYVTVSGLFQEESFHKLRVVKNRPNVDQVCPNIDKSCPKSYNTCRKFPGTSFSQNQQKQRQTARGGAGYGGLGECAPQEDVERFVVVYV